MPYNYTQIFDRTPKVSKSALAVSHYGVNDLLATQIQRQLEELAYDVEKTIINGLISGPGSSGTPRSMGGIMQYMQLAGSGVLTAGAAVPLTEGIMNDAYELGLGNGANNMAVIVCHPNKHRTISTFINNYRRTNVGQSTNGNVAGSFVDQFLSDQGVASNIITSRHMDKDKVLILDPSKISWVPLNGRTFTQEPAQGNGDDAAAVRILGEYTLQFMNA